MDGRTDGRMDMCIMYVCACMCVCIRACVYVCTYVLMYVGFDYTYKDMNHWHRGLNPFWPYKFGFKMLLGLEFIHNNLDIYPL